MKRIVVIWMFFALLVVGAVFEETYIKNSIKTLTEKVNTLEQQIIQQYNGEPALQTIQEMQTYWEKREQILCLLVNYKEVKDIIIQMYRLEETIKQNDEENTFIELEVLKINIEGCKNVIGFNIQNVF